MPYKMTKKRAAALTSYKQARKKFENRVYKQVRQGYTYTGEKPATVAEVRESLSTRQLQSATKRLNAQKSKEIKEKLLFEGKPAEAEIRRRRSESARRGAETRKLRRRALREDHDIETGPGVRNGKSGEILPGISNESGFAAMRAKKDKENKYKISHGNKLKYSEGVINLSKIDDVIEALRDPINEQYILANEIAYAKRFAERHNRTLLSIEAELIDSVDEVYKVYKILKLQGQAALRGLIFEIIKGLTGSVPSAEEMNRIKEETELERTIPFDYDYVDESGDIGGIPIIQSAEETERQEKEKESKQEIYLKGREAYIEAVYTIGGMPEDSSRILTDTLDEAVNNLGYTTVFNNIGSRADEFNRAVDRIAKAKSDLVFDQYQQEIERIIEGR